MNFPKIEYPIFNIDLPLSKIEIQLRVMTVKEEKILLMAKETKNMVDMLDAMYLIIKNCLLDNTIDLDKIPFVELQYIFLHLRSSSVGNIANIVIDDNEDDTKKHKIAINIDNVVFNYTDQSPKIFFSPTNGVMMKHPTFKQIRAINKLKNNSEKTLAYIRHCIYCVFDSDDIYTFDGDDNEVSEYIENLPANYFKLLKDYIDNTPFITYKFTYTNSKGVDVEITLNTLENFI